MHKIRMLGLLFGALLMLLVAGCGDDDCASCPDTVTSLGFGRGVVSYRDVGLWQVISISGYSVMPPVLDSVRVGDSLLSHEEFGVVGCGNVGSMIEFYEGSNSTTRMYDLGDTAVTTVWAQGRSSTCRVKLLDQSHSTIEIISPASSGSDTLSQTGSDTLRWHSVEHADYYAIELWWWYSILDNWMSSHYYTTDTAFIITGAMVPDSMYYCEVTLTPFNGPDPRTDKGNWAGNLLDGVVLSVGSNSGTSFVVSSANPSLRGPSPQVAREKPDLSAVEIVAKVYEKYGRY